MTEIAFHFNAPDKTSYACRLLRKAVGRGSRVVVAGPMDQLKALDQALWTFSALEFLPHCFAGDAASLVAASPVVLDAGVGSAELPQALPHLEVLVNLGHEVPPGFERFERVIEVVATAEADRLQARSRWKHYADRGYAIQKHDLAAAAGA